MNKISVLMKETPEISLAPSTMRTEQKTTILKLKDNSYQPLTVLAPQSLTSQPTEM